MSIAGSSSIRPGKMSRSSCICTSVPPFVGGPKATRMRRATLCVGQRPREVMAGDCGGTGSDQETSGQLPPT